jgi:hypothetical protein
VDEKIKPFKVTNWAELISKLDGKHYSFAKEHIEFPWLKEEQG